MFTEVNYWDFDSKININKNIIDSILSLLLLIYISFIDLIYFIYIFIDRMSFDSAKCREISGLCWRFHTKIRRFELIL